MDKFIKKGKKIIITVIIIAAAIAAVYIAGCFYFSTRFYSGSVMGVNMFGKTANEVNTRLAEKIDDAGITLNSRNGDIWVSAEDMGISTDNTDRLTGLINKQKPYAWPAGVIKAGKTYSITADEQGAEDVLMALPIFKEEDMTPPEDAYIKYNDSEFVIMPEEEGNLLDAGEVVSDIVDAFNNGKGTFSLEEHYKEPSIRADNEDLLQECADVNNLIACEIDYTIGDYGIFSVTQEIVAGWVVFDDDFSYHLDEDAVHAFVDDMAAQTDTFGLSHTFTTHYGDTIDLYGGDYGWCMYRDETTAALIDMINEGYSGDAEPVYLYTAQSRDKNDIGNSYVEISIDAQTMWVYKDDECVIETPVVTGNTSLGRGTPSGGVWAIDTKGTDVVLKGQGYSSHVNYWMPFNGGVGIHDASWRSSFGGSIYKTNGSHGCINTPPGTMPSVYDACFIGEAVAVY